MAKMPVRFRLPAPKEIILWCLFDIKVFILLNKGDYMASSEEFKNYVLDRLNLLENITYRKMMGEYLLYYNGVYFGGIYDDRFMVKMTQTNEKYHMEEELPYDSAKPMYLVSESLSKEELIRLVQETVSGLQKQ